ncbi:hypothetical protein LTR36_003960 [Oleoguttula mirabilis]|uniref:N-acetyltransferase domain-containing protein n=1 Tax=Oleoguttula mirabilis TaxID=1507867 RepID=A0AAV9JIH8_9PEZI|nr:hypothetical protein LTR36_003960 [Oleoguttula mirabilis]
MPGEIATKYTDEMAGATQPSTVQPALAIKDASVNDAEAIAPIYNYYVRTSIASLQEGDSTVDAIRSKLDSIRSKAMPYVLAQDTTTGAILGYAYADDWHERTGYRFTVECSIYLHADHCGKGYGKLLLPAVLAKLRACGKKQVLAKISILPEQAAQDVPSCRLHVAFGFQPVGRLLKVGFKMGKWVDVLFLQLDLEKSVK